MGGAKKKKKDVEGLKRKRLKQKKKKMMEEEKNIKLQLQHEGGQSSALGARGIADEQEPIQNFPTNMKDSKQLAFPTVGAGAKLSNMRRNILGMLKTTNEQVVYHRCEGFDVMSEIRNKIKKQPDSNRQEDFEAFNEPQLEPISGNIIIISDKHGVPCVIKAGNNRATQFREVLEPAIVKYAKSRGITADHVRHGAVGSRDRFKSASASSDLDVDATTLLSADENGTDGATRVKGCVIAHRAFVPRTGTRTHDIKLRAGPAQACSSQEARAALQELSKDLRPLTQTVEKLFETFLPDEHAKYTQAYNGIYDNIHGQGNRDAVDSAFGIFTSRSLVINANTNNHKDLEDICQGWCAIVALGGFEGGDACFPQLGVKIDCTPGSVVFLRSYAVEHYSGSYVGNRYSVVHFTHQTVHDAYAEMTGGLLWEFQNMPEWWRASRENLTGTQNG